MQQPSTQNANVQNPVIQKPVIHYQSPALLGANSVLLNEAQTLGTVAWLMLHSELHAGLAIGQLATMYLPAIKSGQYILGIQNDTAVFYCAWAKMSAEMEYRYLTQGPLSITADSWQSGERVWLMDWIAPFGHVRQITHDLKHRLWQTGIGRALYLPPNKNKEMRLMQLHGVAVTPKAAQAHFEQQPLMAALPKRHV